MTKKAKQKRQMHLQMVPVRKRLDRQISQTLKRQSVVSISGRTVNMVKRGTDAHILTLSYVSNLSSGAQGEVAVIRAASVIFFTLSCAPAQNQIHQEAQPVQGETATSFILKVLSFNPEKVIMTLTVIMIGPPYPEYSENNDRIVQCNQKGDSICPIVELS